MERFVAHCTADRDSFGRRCVPSSDVLAAVAGADECLRAERAAEGPLTGVLASMSIETAFVGEFSATTFATLVTPPPVTARVGDDLARCS